MFRMKSGQNLFLKCQKIKPRKYFFILLQNGAKIEIFRISRLPIRTPSPPQKVNPETESETDPPTPDEELEHQTPPDQCESDHDIEPEVLPESTEEQPEVSAQKPEVSTFQSVTNNLMGLNFMMESCEIGDVGCDGVENQPELDKNTTGIQVEGNLNFLVESNIEQEDVRRLPMSNVTNLEDIEGDQHVIKQTSSSDHYPYHTDTVKFLESSKFIY